MGAPRACLIFITIHLVSLATSQEVDKRVPQGFVGMRGKKYFDDEGTEQFYKRKPQFFVGVKGKKSLHEILETPEEFYKRAPMGFMGMRGKKDPSFPELDSLTSEQLPKKEGSLIGQIDYSSSNENHEPDFALLNELLVQYITNMALNSPHISSSEEIDSGEPITNEIEKRAAHMHQFFGVRGKKSVNNKRPYDLTFRGKFIGVRGKKDLKNSGPHEIKFLFDHNGPLPKRKAQMGFFGMRGKKWAEELPSPDQESPI